MIDDSQDELEAPWGGMFPHPVLGLSTTPRRPTKMEMRAMWQALNAKMNMNRVMK
jgi:hypothetical protein